MDWPHVQKNALKTALGVTLAYAIAMWLNWDNPVWAGLGVWITRLPYAGMTIHKISMRIIGTFVGATILAIAATCYASYWTLVNEERLDRGVMCTYENSGYYKTIWRQSYCPYNLY